MTVEVCSNRKNFKEKIKEKYKECFELEKDKYFDANGIYIDFDGWTNENGTYFLGINSHFLNDDFTLNKRHIGVATFEEIHHDGTIKKEKIKEICKSLNIWEKIKGMVTNGAETSLNILLNINSIWCIVHIFNLVIKDVLFNKQKNSEKFEDEEYFLEELTEIRNFITSIRKSTVYSKFLYVPGMIYTKRRKTFASFITIHFIFKRK